MATDERYVAFVDLLGFSDLVQNAWDDAMAKYKWFVELAETIENDSRTRHRWQGKPTTPDPDLIIASDSVIVVGEHLWRVLEMVQAVQTAALLGNGMLVRGCVAFGKHFHESGPNRYTVVSVPLSLAVAGEKLAHYPRVILDRASGAERHGRGLMREGSPIVLPCDDGLMMVQPFILQAEYNLDHYENTLAQLAAKYVGTRHAPKWDWMHSCVRAVERHLEELAEVGEEIEAERAREDALFAEDDER